MRRLTYLSVLGLVGAVAYDGYKDRHPDEQYTPDPQKKTLVILGKWAWSTYRPSRLGYVVSELTLTCN